ncbi:DUF6210 family protein [Sandaracinus amylolyticus]|uniref:DUF6210 family protein n=1 Tax=Sandaracinus amylolyticus TaxID=927083 RepID=UPI001F3D584F|nr:DUF6210 family protein [Sandaracinus amylolyticus]UJR80275.1 Hypothetical protein I5071_23190 [Sandaracinus amylolyticus]
MHVDFCEESVVYLIVACSSGITYSAQAGGVACLHPSVEGAVIAAALEPSAQRLAAAMHEVSCWHEVPWLLADVERANLVLGEMRFECFSEIVSLRLDPERLGESVEGWWWVTFELRDPLDGVTVQSRGVLCGPNCD